LAFFFTLLHNPLVYLSLSDILPLSW